MVPHFSEYRKEKKSSKEGKDYSGSYLLGGRTDPGSTASLCCCMEIIGTGFNQ